MANFRWQALILIALVLITFMITKTKIISFNATKVIQSRENLIQTKLLSNTPSFERTPSQINSNVNFKKMPLRRWDVLDSEVTSEAVLIQSLENDFPFFKYNTSKTWPIASLTKLITAIVVLEDIGKNKKISISENVVATEGKAGDLKIGEVYRAEDLLKIMLLTSSNDAAAAFEEYLGGKDAAARILNNKITKLGMNETIVHDTSGLSDLNESTVNDLLILAKYIIKNKPEILNWTRLPNLIIEPLNDPKSRTIYNINSFVADSNFLGGKTGTSQETRENFLAVFSLDKSRVIVILLGSQDRTKETKKLLDWVKEAYFF
ncbi:MAG: serine hydrolase [Patescibacteria group bacterium]|nr:serine hydrolase [Patescibacteria group bacterium]